MAIRTSSIVVLTDTPQLIAEGVAYLQMHDGKFCFAYSDLQPDKTAAYIDEKVYTDGSLGKLWAWKYSKPAIVTPVNLVVTLG